MTPEEVSLLTLGMVWVGGLLIGVALGWRPFSSPETSERGRGVARAMPPHYNCRSSYVTENSSAGTLTGQSITGTWASTMGDADRPGPDEVPRGFRGEDLTDRQVDEWLRENGLKGYD